VRWTVVVVLLLGMVGGCRGTAWPEVSELRPAAPRGAQETVVAFASCLKEKKPAPIFDHVLASQPDVMVMMGDNVYVDLPDRPVRASDFRDKYDTLAAQPYWQELNAAVPVLATWDDHDYGLNDAGSGWHLKETAKDEFIRFYGVPLDAAMRGREGIYSKATLGEPGKRVQVILLDTRTFRGKLSRKMASGLRQGGPYRPSDDTSRELLGEAQWQWLEQTLHEPAEVRVIVSSIQVVAREHGWECWGNFPHELDRLYRTIRVTGANGVVFVSGDRHLAELSRDADPAAPYPMWDATSSGLNQGERKVSEPNRYRVGGVRRLSHFGLIRVDWSGDPRLTFELVDSEGEVFESATLNVAELDPGFDRVRLGQAD